MSPLLIVIILFIVLLFLGAPAYLAMIIPSLAYFFMNPVMNSNTILQKLVTGLNSFPLMAIPFFMVAAEIMNTGGITNRIFKAARSMVGHFRGGLGHVNILASIIFSGMSGSALADVGGLGQVELKAMREAGYDDDFTIGLTAASGTIGPIIPPSIPFVIYSSYVSVSTGALFAGGIIPGLVIALCLCVMTFVLSKRNNYPKDEKLPLKTIVKDVVKSLPSLLMPIIIIGGIWSGYFTATEAAAIAILYAIILTVLIYRDITIFELPAIILKSVQNALPIFMVIIGATLISFIINFEKVDELVLNFLTSFTSSKIVVLLLLNIVLIILGMFFDAIVAILLMAPILPTLCAAYALQPIHIGVVIVLNLMVGLITPPVGTSLYLLSTVTKYPVTRVINMIKIWLIPLFTALLIITYNESLVMWLPRLLGFAK